MATIAIYTRISQNRAEDDLAVARQLEDCRALAERMGFSDFEEYRDDGVSAFGKKARPAFERLLSDLHAGRHEAVCAWNSDRLYRRMPDLTRYLEVVGERKLATHYVQGGGFDYETPNGILIANVLGSVAENEMRTKSVRTKRQRQQGREAGRSGFGARVPFGWSWDGENYHAHETEAEWVKDAHTWFIAGDSLRTIATKFNEAGFTTRQGKPFSYVSVRQMLRRPGNVGEQVYGETGETYSSDLPPLVARHVWNGVQDKLNDPSRKTAKESKVRHLLSGLGYCHCGYPLAVRHTRGKPSYVCGRFSYPATGREDQTVTRHCQRRVEQVDEYVERVMMAWLPVVVGREQIIGTESAPDLGAIRIEIAGLEETRAGLDRDLKTGRLDYARWSDLDHGLASTLAAKQEALHLAEQAEQVRLIPAGQVQEYWVGLSIERRRKLLASVLTVALSPSTNGRHTPIEDVVTMTVGSTGLDMRELYEAWSDWVDGGEPSRWHEAMKQLNPSYVAEQSTVTA